MIEEIKPKGSSKTIDEVIEIHEKEFKDAVLSAEIAVVENAGFVLSDAAVKKTQNLREMMKGEEFKKTIAKINKASLIYSFVFGNYKPSRSWIRIDKDLYVRLSPLRSVGKHSVLTTVFRNKIAGLLEKNIDNAMLSVLKRGGVEVAATKRKFCFPKGHFLEPELTEVVSRDLKIIFEQMAQPAGKRDFSKLNFFNKK